jgi:DNA-binding transcriptional MerR regulator
MRIGDLAARTGVSVRSLRYYEQQGLLTSSRSPSGQRHYTDDQEHRVAYIQQLFAAGLSSRTIAETLPCVESPGSDTSDAAFVRLVEERDKLTALIDQLVGTRASLDQIITWNREHRAQLDKQPASA